MSFISSIHSIANATRNSIANLIAADRAPTVMIVDNAKSLTHANAPAHVLSQAERAEQTAMAKGKFYVIDLPTLNSERVRDAIASLGCWSAIARGFSEYERTVGHKHMSDAKLVMLIDEYHAWNASASARGYMNTDQLFEAVAKMSVVNPPKGSAETDAILARVKKMSVADIRAERMKKAETKTAARIEMIEGFVATVEGYQGSDIDHHAMSAAKALDKAIQTLDWVAGWDSNNPTEQAAELLLIEDDIKMIREALKHERSNTEDYVDGVMASDTMVRNAQAMDNGRRAGESAKGFKGYEPEPMEEVLEHFAQLEEQGRAIESQPRRRVVKSA